MRKELEIEEKYRIIVRLAKMLHKYGTSSFRVEAYVTEVVQHWGLNCDILDSPTSLSFSFSDGNHDGKALLIRSKPGEINLGALSKVTKLIYRILEDKYDLSEITERLDAIESEKPYYSNFVEFLSFALGSGGFSLLYDSNWVTCFISVFLGGVVYLLWKYAMNHNFMIGMFEILSTFVSAVLACVLSLYFPELSIPIAILSAVIVYVPGLSISLALEELSSRGLLAGTARLMDAFVVMIKLIVGALVGVQLMEKLLEIPHTYTIDPVTPLTKGLAIVLLSFCIAVLFNVQKREVIFGVISGSIAYLCSYMLGQYIGEIPAIFVASMLVGIYSCLLGGWRDVPTLVYIVQGIIIMVPGSRSYIGITDFYFNQPTTPSDNMGQSALFMFAAILGGLIISNSIFTMDNLKRIQRFRDRFLHRRTISS
ncbi:threonine/serine exporter family protein [Halosquirtibacter laminarini]|uniref:Threonine/serine exporter family protein n=1 Tax=Halosquirtibacter laminarini TaxID=3374600 RepID=A0AC61NI09_9BACT|nr:threonine/serine exporter family protein [Prolixibacteraceae bacterium]